MAAPVAGQKPEGPQKPPSEAGPLPAAADRLRSGVNALIVALGAIAAATLGGISLSSLGAIDPVASPALFSLAVGGGAAGVIGAVGALITATIIAVQSTVTIGDLSDAGTTSRWRRELLRQLADDPAISGWTSEDGTTGVPAFIESYKKANKKLNEVNRSALGDAAAAPPEQAADGKSLNDGIAWMTGKYNSLMRSASYLRLTMAFRRSIGWICGFVALAAVGVMVFSYATASAAHADERGPTELTRMAWSVPDNLQDIITRQLGDACEYSPADVPVMAGQVTAEGERKIVTIPADDCASLELVVPAAQLVDD